MSYDADSVEEQPKYSFFSHMAVLRDFITIAAQSC